MTDPPSGDGRKVVISDTDHYAPFQGDALWAWKSFLRGHNPILYDLGIIGGAKPLDPTKSGSGAPPYQAFEAARYALGDTLHYAQAVKLVDMEPNGELSSTGYALASLGRKYLVLQPSESAEPVTLQLPAGKYDVQWFSLDRRTATDGEQFRVAHAGSVTFDVPLASGHAVLHLRRTEIESSKSE